MELNAAIPQRLLDIPDAVQQEFMAKYPGELVHYDFPAGVYDGQDYPVNTMAWPTDWMMGKHVPAWVAYDFMEAMSREREVLAEAMPGPTEYFIEFERICLELLKPPALLHAGVVQWYKDKGFTVPANITPPEYTDMPDLKKAIK